MTALEVINESGTGLRARFVRNGDRYAHVVDFLDQGVALPLLASDEGDAEQEWPPSPPLQQVSFEERSVGNVLLGLGMAGRTHWSMSIEADVMAVELRFDVAARLRDHPQRLGSRYRLSGPAPIESAEGAIEFSLAGGRARVCCDAHTILTPSTSEIVLESRDGDPPPTTTRWAYRIRLST